MLEKQSLQKRDLQKLTNIAGGYLVGTDYLSSNFIELLRNKMLVQQMGAKVMSGLHGDIAIPKQTGGATTFWVARSSSDAISAIIWSSDFITKNYSSLY